MPRGAFSPRTNQRENWTSSSLPAFEHSVRTVRQASTWMQQSMSRAPGLTHSRLRSQRAAGGVVACVLLPRQLRHEGGGGRGAGGVGVGREPAKPELRRLVAVLVDVID